MITSQGITIKKKTLKFWKQSFGKAEIVQDFAGREIHKNDYNKGSEYDWCITRILPAIKGGKKQDDNVVCANIKTNSEKGADFPDFTANGQKFSIQPYGDHYTIVKLIESPSIPQSDIIPNDEPNDENQIAQEQENDFSGKINVDLVSIENTKISKGLNILFPNANIQFLNETSVLISFKNKSKEEFDEISDRFEALKACLAKYYTMLKLEPNFSAVLEIEE